jgi:hypothetical protein
MTRDARLQSWRASPIAFVASLWCLTFVSAARAEVSRYALIIGENKGDTSDVVLRYAESDGQRIATVLRQIGNFRPEDVTVLNGVVAEDVRRALIGLNARLRQTGGETLLFVFYSGHADAENLHLAGTHLLMSELKGLLAGSPATARVLVVDACRSGALTRVKGGRQAPSFDIRVDAPLGAQGLAILTSSAAGEDAQESDQLGASFFTHYFASALMGAADRDHDGKVTLSEAFDQSSGRTLAATMSTMAGPQHPTFRIDLGGRDDLVLTQPGASHGNVGTLQFATPGSYLVARPGADGAIVAELTTRDPSGRLALDGGRYRVTMRTTDYLLQGEFDVPAARTTIVRPETMQRVDYAKVVRKGGTDRSSAFSVFLLGGARGAILDLGTSWSAALGGRIALHVLSVELRGAFGQSGVANRYLHIATRETATSFAAMRAFDLGRQLAGWNRCRVRCRISLRVRRRGPRWCCRSRLDGIRLLARKIHRARRHRHSLREDGACSGKRFRQK